MSRTTVFKLHKWCGIFLAMPLLLQSVTGVSLVYRGDLAALIDPSGMTRQSVGAGVPLSDIYDALNAEYKTFEVQRLVVPRTQNGVYFAHMIDPSGNVRYASIDPGTAEVLQYGSVWRFPLEAAVQIHFNLMAGRIGLTIVILNALVLLLMIYTGLRFWWPRQGGWRKALAVRWRFPARVILRHAHRTIGVTVSILLAVTAVTGSVMALEPLLSGARLTSVHASGRPAIGTRHIDDALAQARTLFPGSAVHDFRRPAPDQFYVLFKAPSVGPRAVHFVRFDLKTGALEERRFAKDIVTLANRLYPIHTGELIAGIGQLAVLTSGILLAGLAGSGFVMWIQAPSPKRPVRRESRRRAKARIDT